MNCFKAAPSGGDSIVNAGRPTLRGDSDAMIEIEICLFNSLAQYAPANGTPFLLSLPAGAKADALPHLLRIPAGRIFAAWRNGRDIMTTFGGQVVEGIDLQPGDRIALSGPVPFSRGYGAPVC